MKLLNKQFITEQEQQNSTLQELRVQLAPLTNFIETAQKQYEQKREEFSKKISELIAGNIPMKSTVRAEFDNYSIEDLKIQVYHPKHDSQEEENRSWNPSFEIRFVDDIKDYWEDEKKAKVKVGDIEQFGKNTHTNFDLEEPELKEEYFDLLIVQGAMAQWAKQDLRDWQTIRNYFLELNNLDKQIEDAKNKQLELNTKIKIEHLSFIKFELEMKFYEGNSVLEIEPYEKSSYEKEAKYPRYWLRESTLHTIQSIARLTAEICERSPNFEWDSKKSKDKREPYNFSTGRSRKEKIEAWQDELAKNVVNNEHILILLNKTETAQLLEVTKANKFVDKTLLKEIMAMLEKESENYKEEVDSKQ